MASFCDPDIVSGYAARTEQLVPGLRHLHKMTGLLLAERAPADARVLVLGAGGGMELKALAELQPEWRFDGIDPSAEMLQLAETNLGSLASRVTFQEGYIDKAPEGPFDAATCLLTLHFLPRGERLQTLRGIQRRLKPGAPFVAAHHSFPTQGAEPDKWLTRFAAFASLSGVLAFQSENNIRTMKERLPVLSPEEDEALLREAGFSNIELFYAGLTFKGWVAYK
ncbi:MULTISPECIES: class I SAM-dependent methyltransferase [unclassified Phyllobacterium]|uniref:class I SAM-dependent methyltransferase n=1 Tax=unclassified Phyllobacterium TaxID=2638441 RepID=UPI003012AD67